MFCPKCGKDAGDAKFCPECGEKMPVPAETPETPETSDNTAETAQPTAVVETPQPEKKSKKKLIAVVAAAAAGVVVILIIVFAGGKSGIEKEIVGTWKGNLTWSGSNRDDYTVTVTFNKDKTGEIQKVGLSRYPLKWEIDKDPATGEKRIKAIEQTYAGEEIAYYTMGTSETDGTYIRRDAFINGRLFKVN